MASAKREPVVAKKAHSAGEVILSIALRCSGWNSDRAKIEGSASISTQQARKLASDLLALADTSDAKVAAAAASDARRKAWRDREVASGRMKVLDASDFFSRGRG